jgi:hypothetical protein
MSADYQKATDDYLDLHIARADEKAGTVLAEAFIETAHSA